VRPGHALWCARVGWGGVGGGGGSSRACIVVWKGGRGGGTEVRPGRALWCGLLVYGEGWVRLVVQPLGRVTDTGCLCGD
jgi:hypothetical protein